MTGHAHTEDNEKKGVCWCFRNEHRRVFECFDVCLFDLVGCSTKLDSAQSRPHLCQCFVICRNTPVSRVRVSTKLIMFFQPHYQPVSQKMNTFLMTTDVRHKICLFNDYNCGATSQRPSWCDKGVCCRVQRKGGIHFEMYAQAKSSH